MFVLYRLSLWSWVSLIKGIKPEWSIFLQLSRSNSEEKKIIFLEVYSSKAMLQHITTSEKNVVFKQLLNMGFEILYNKIHSTLLATQALSVPALKE